MIAFHKLPELLPRSISMGVHTTACREFCSTQHSAIINHPALTSLEAGIIVVGRRL